MATQDKVLLMHKVEETLKPRMFANLMEEAVVEINDHLDEFDVTHLAVGDGSQDNMLDAFINAKRTEGRSEKTLTRYMYAISRFMKFANVKTKDVNTYHVRDYLSHEEERGIADMTLEGIREVLSAYFGWLEHEKMIYTNPVSSIAVIRCQKKIRESLSQGDIFKLKRSCGNLRDTALVNFMLSTGCRISEITALNIVDLDLERGECIVLGKGNKERTVYLNEVAVMTIREYLAMRRDSCEALFVSLKKKQRLNPGGVRAMLKKLSAKAGVENVHPHRFRRTLITQLLRNGMQIHEVAIIAGHEKVDTTMKYFHINKDQIKNSYQRYSA